MSTGLSVSGVYDHRTLNFLLDNHVGWICFDLRPRSLNFIQEYRLAEIIKNRVGFSVILQFQNEKDFVIKKIIQTCRDSFDGEIILQFSGSETLEFCDQFEIGYIKKIDEFSDFQALGKNQKGLLFPLSMIEAAMSEGSLEASLVKLYRLLGERSMDCLQVLQGDWDSDFAPSLSDLLDLDFLQFSINHKVEVCFRNVDLQKMGSTLKLTPKSLF